MLCEFVTQKEIPGRISLSGIDTAHLYLLFFIFLINY